MCALRGISGTTSVPGPWSRVLSDENGILGCRVSGDSRVSG